MVRLRVIYVPKFPALLSIIGSTMVIIEVIQDIRFHNANVVSRVVLSMSVGDILWSLGWFIGTWLSPRHLTHLQGANYGTYATCVFHGFIQEVGVISSAFMNSSLALIYLLIVKFNYREQALKKVETWIQTGVWSFALVCGIIPIFLNMYHNSGPVCWINSYPPKCIESWQIPASSDEVTNCTMGDNSIFFNLVLGIIPVTFCILFNGVMMFVIFRTSRRTERNSNRYLYGSGEIRSSEDRSRSFRRSRMVAQQGILYMSGFLMTYLLYPVSVIVFLINGRWNGMLDLVGYCFLGSQGIFNFVIFSRLRNMRTSVGTGLRRFIWDICAGRIVNVYGKIKQAVSTRREETERNRQPASESDSNTSERDRRITDECVNVQVTTTNNENESHHTNIHETDARISDQCVDVQVIRTLRNEPEQTSRESHMDDNNAPKNNARINNERVDVRVEVTDSHPETELENGAS